MILDLHGGNIHDRDIKIDFSSNINPFGPPDAVKDYLSSDEYLRSHFVYPRVYPERLIRALSEVLGVSENCIAVGPGSSFFIYVFSWIFRGKKVVIPSPTFIEYERAALSSGCEVMFMALREDMNFRICLGELTSFSMDADAIFLCNPNNPTGGYMDSQELEALFRWASRTGCIVFVDEAYKPFVGDIGPKGIPENAVFLGSFTKSYGIPGVRLGYIYGGKSIMEVVKRFVPPWPLSGGAEEIGLLCLSSSGFIDKTRRLLASARAFLKDSLEDIGFKVFPSVANFLLAKGSWNPYHFLLKNRILIRRCENIRGLGPEFFRVSVRSMDECKVLVELLAKGYKEHAC